MSKRSNNLPCLRASSRKVKIKGDLRGMKAREYYAHERMTKNVVAACRRHLDHNLWVKLDRCKPVTKGQAEKIEDALNRAAVEQPEWPFAWPHVKFNFVDLGCSRPGIMVEWVEVRRMPKVESGLGTAYTPNTEDTVSFGGRDGMVVYSKHALEQLVNRVPWLRESGAIKYTPSLVQDVLRDVASAGVVERGAYGPCLVVRSQGGTTLGFFPMVSDVLDGKPVWVCKTFLSPGMRGLPKHEAAA